MAEKLFYSMGEVAEMFDVKPSLLRFWEGEFSVLRPKRNKKGNRLFSPADVANLKVIYHLVKERGMTLDGAKKALKQQRTEGGSVVRDAELMERLQHIRSLLVEVREDLKAGADDILTDTTDGELASGNVADNEVVAQDVAAVVSGGSGAEMPAEKRPRAKTKPVVKIDDDAEPAVQTESIKQPTVRRPRRKKEEGETKELFAFFEQKLF